jgi:NAD(P) transhydrogenase
MADIETFDLVVIGSGPAGEKGAVQAAYFGKAVALVERALGLEREGHRVRLGDAVSAITRIPGGPLRIQLKSGADLLVDKVLYSAGRTGNTRGLGLDCAGVKMDDKGRILVNEHFQTSTADIYAAGDVIGNPALASVSMGATEDDLKEKGSLSKLGAHIIGEGATELIHIAQMVMHAQGTIDLFIDTVFNFPTLSELYKYAAYDGLGRVARRRGQA